MHNHIGPLNTMSRFRKNSSANSEKTSSQTGGQTHPISMELSGHGWGSKYKKITLSASKY